VGENNGNKNTDGTIRKMRNNSVFQSNEDLLVVGGAGFKEISVEKTTLPLNMPTLGPSFETSNKASHLIKANVKN
jgi:hypothetical protein